MWIMLNDGFLSVVDKAKLPAHLMVRARRPGDIEKLFPGVTVRESTTTDYRYRAEIPRIKVAEVMAAQVMGIGYSNFKGSTKDKDLHDAYMRVWDNMEVLQPGGAYGARERRLRAGRAVPHDHVDEPLPFRSPRGRRTAR